MTLFAPGWDLYHGDALEKLQALPSGTVNTCVTSPPYYGLRDYGVDGQIGLEPTPDEYISRMVEVFREVRRVLRDDGTCWINLGDSYASDPGKGYSGADPKWTEKGTSRARTSFLPPKNLMGMPWRVAFALQADGWYLRSDIIWHKPNPMPESVTDRPTKAHEYIFLLSKSERYYYDAEAIKEPAQEWTGQAAVFERSGAVASHILPGQNAAQHRGKGNAKTLNVPNEAGTRNKRTVWTIATRPYAAAHFATFPPDLIKPCILAGCPEGGIVLDPFAGSGTTLWVAEQLGRQSTGIELNPEYCNLVYERMGGESDRRAGE